MNLKHETGTVYFFTGLSGAGKTTLGSLFYQRLKSTKPNVVFLDGDQIRPVFGEDSGYTYEDRLKWAGRIFRVCKMLSEQGIDVICCSIAMFSSIREWNRANIPAYKEIYIRVKKETLMSRNQKGLYTKGHNVVGIDLPFDEPQSPDIIIQNDGLEAPQTLVERLEAELYHPVYENSVDNVDYWNQYYKNKICSTEPSPFAQYVATLIDSGKSLVDLGCGNGRDTVYFAGLGLQVTGVDLSDISVRSLQEQNIPGARFICGDFVNPKEAAEDSFDYAYSRFTIHAINEQQERTFLKNIYEQLHPKGKFFIEVRSIHDPLFGKGKKMERNAYFYDNHYRRFIVMDELVQNLEQVGFQIEYAKEQSGFAPYGNDDPPVIRIVAKKLTSFGS